MFDSLIIGLGHAGAGLHLPCLARAREAARGECLFDDVAGVDPAPAARPSGLPVFLDVRAARAFDPARTVVHICTPPGAHVEALRCSAEVGYRRFLMEKPLATSLAGVAEAFRLSERYQLDVLVIANWLHSSVTERLVGLAKGGAFGPLRALRFEQHKPRASRTLEDCGHTTAFDVEMPHQVALALYLGGRPAAVVNAASAPLRAAERTVEHMGAACLELQHSGDCYSMLVSHLAGVYKLFCLFSVTLCKSIVCESLFV